MSTPLALGWIETDAPALGRLNGGCLAIGTFDGVHRGHQDVLASMRAEADRRGFAAGVLTFHPHPLEVLRPASAPRLLTPVPERVRELRRRTGPATAIGVLEFTQSFANLAPERFVDEVLVQRLAVGHVCVGYNFSFGREGAGNVETLRRLGGRHGLDVTVVPPTEVDGRPVSSSEIRQRLRDGDLAGARRLLGRPFTVSGVVEEGAGRGRQLGFPTANLATAPRQLLPARGVYVVEAELNGGARPGVANIGVRPTFDDADERLEVHLLDLNRDLYGQRLAVTFLSRLRPERRFQDPDALRIQLEHDVAEARRRLAGGLSGR